MLPLRTDTKYVTPDGRLTQAGVEAIQGLISANSADIAAAEVDIAALEAVAISSAPGTAPRYACRAWVNFNGTGTVAIRASANVASITDNGVGDYTVNFTTAMPDANYVAVISAGNGSAAVGYCGPFGAVPTASSFRFATVAASAAPSLADYSFINVAIFR